MHTSVSIEEISKYSEMVHKGKVVRTLQPISKTICAFLNTKGGKIYLGVSNDGVIKGVRMNDFLLEHFVYSLDDTLSRFKPRPPSDAIKIEIYPLLDASEEINTFTGDQERINDADGWMKSDSKTIELEKPKFSFKETKAIHTLRGERCTPCLQSIRIGEKPAVIVINVEKSSGPIYSNEEGLAYQRTWAGNRMMSIDKLRQCFQAALGEKGFDAIDKAFADEPVIFHEK
ncbi:unnamed protein product, partial [Mesorhabditis belari]|uniref:Schlafen AlbA-2 domain-containing protein n=1 Tax=Mesorhabditis belari TaxID=2138241 RepID=A0AAF3FMT3_9BILA